MWTFVLKPKHLYIAPLTEESFPASCGALAPGCEFDVREHHHAGASRPDRSATTERYFSRHRRLREGLVAIVTPRYHDATHTEPIEEQEMERKAMTVRIPSDQAAELAAVAEVDGVPVSEAIRQAISEHIQTRRRDAAFRARLKASLERNRKILEKLAL